MTHHRRPVALEPDLPEHRVAGERGVVAAAGHEALDGVATCGRPVLVVPGADHEPVPVGEPVDLLEVARDRVVDVEAGLLGPLHESAVVGEPSGGAHVTGEAVLVAEGSGTCRRRCRAPHRVGGAATCGPRGRRRDGPASRDPMAVGTRPLCRPCTGCTRPSCCTRSTCSWRARTGCCRGRGGPHDEAGVRDGAAARCVVGGHRDEVEPGRATTARSGSRSEGPTRSRRHRHRAASAARGPGCHASTRPAPASLPNDEPRRRSGRLVVEAHSCTTSPGSAALLASHIPRSRRSA